MSVLDRISVEALRSQSIVHCVLKIQQWLLLWVDSTPLLAHLYSLRFVGIQYT